MPRKIRPIRVEGNIAYVPLTRGHEATIDADDLYLVDKFNWQAKYHRSSKDMISTVYAATSIPNGRKQKTTLMHRVIIGAPPEMLVDHADCDGLNNTKKNLRVASCAENSQNQRTACNNTSGVKGVTFDRSRGEWRARIGFNNQRYSLGVFRCRTAALFAYALGVHQMHGKFGRVK